MKNENYKEDLINHLRMSGEMEYADISKIRNDFELIENWIDFHLSIAQNADYIIKMWDKNVG